MYGLKPVPFKTGQSDIESKFDLKGTAFRPSVRSQSEYGFSR
jgi:hypothetical protein